MKFFGLTRRPSRQRLRNRIRLSLTLMLIPLTLAGAAGTFALTRVVEAFEDVPREQRSELLPLGPFEATVRLYENAAYSAYYTNDARELESLAPKVARDLASVTSAMDRAAERRELERVRVSLERAASVLETLLARSYPQRADIVTPDPLLEFASLLDDAVGSVHATQRLAVAESAREVEQAHTLRIQVAVAFALLFLAAAVGAALIAHNLGRHVLEPLGRLVHASRRIGDGDLGHRVALERDDELGAAGVAFDAMVMQLQESRRQLEQSQERLHQSQKLEAVGQLAGGIAHDFNNLLLVIEGYTTLVGDTLDDDDPRKADLAVAQSATERAAQLTQQLLTFSRREVAAPAIVDVNASLTRVDAMVRRLIPANVSVDLVLHPETAATRIDPGQLEQVVVNLVLNARDAVGEGGRIVVSSSTVQVDTTFASQHPGLTPGSYVTIGVADDGSGMSRELAARIFEPFFTTKPRGSGTGLGLAVTYGIVTEAGGTISVYSEPGHGSTFTVYLPASSVPASVEEQPSDEPCELPPATVLVAEDEPTIRTLIERTLADAGVTTVVAGSAEEALVRAGDLDGDFDLLLTDLVMPGQGGRDLADALERAYGPSPVVFISGYSDDALRLAPGAAFLQKPFTRDSLLRVVAEQLAAA